MSHSQGPLLISRVFKVKTQVIVGLSILIVLLESSVTASDEFCGHSVDSQERRVFLGKYKRSVPDLRSHQQRAGDFRDQDVPKNHQEDQIVIDETSSIGQNNQQQDTSARVDCSKTVSSSSRSSGSSDNAKLDVDCSTKTIETAVFIDHALDNKFIGLSNGLVELNKLVLTIMNQVQYLFKYSSMKVPIKIKLVLVEHLRDSEKHGHKTPNPEQGDIDAYLSNFCNWQKSRLDREKRLWWDHAILLSG